MNNERQGEGPGAAGTGNETSLGGESQWSTVPSDAAEAEAGRAEPVPQSPESVAPPEPVAPHTLEPLPQPVPADPTEASASVPTGPPVPPPAYDAGQPGYTPVYETNTGQQQPPPPPGGYGGGPGGYSQGGPGAYTQGGPGGYPPGPPPGYGPGYGGAGGSSTPPGQGMSSTAAAAVSYITFIPAVIFLVMEPYNRDRFIRFHAWQCIALTVVWVGLGIVFSVLGFAGLHLLLWLIHSLIVLALFVFWLIALIKASQGQWYRIPLIGDLAESFSGRQH